jgi:DNA-directed RNA polymerase subunit RPC12/RpoP
MKPRNYECRKCGKINQITTLFGMFITPHLGWHKWIKCKHCGAKRHFQRRVFKPEMEVRRELEIVKEELRFYQLKVGGVETDWA